MVRMAVQRSVDGEAAVLVAALGSRRRGRLSGEARMTLETSTAIWMLAELGEGIVGARIVVERRPRRGRW